MTWMRATQKHSTIMQSKRGFTIVELLIVITIIAILAAITIVAYNNIQSRTMFSRYQSDLKSITKALALYKVDNDRYPATIGQSGCTYDWCGWDQVTGDDFITGLSPKYLAKIPQMPTSLPSNDTFLYRSTGTDYQLIRYRFDGLPYVETQNNPLLATTDGYEAKGGLAWGYRTNTDGHWW